MDVNRVRQRIGLRVFGLSIALLSPAALAFDIQHSHASYVEEEYRFEFTAVLDAPIDYVEIVLRDYEHYPALDSRILEAHVLDRPTMNVATLATTLRACFGPICRSVRRVERVEETPHGLLAVTDPQRSDMELGETRTQLEEAEAGRTRVIYRTRLRPDFWVPALVGRRMMLTTLEDATVDLFRNVEKTAQQHADAGRHLQEPGLPR